MMKGIKISTKITLLILFLAVVAVTAVSLFTYDYVIKTNQEKFTTNLNVIADNRAAYFNAYFDKIASALKLLQESDVIKAGNQSASVPDATVDLMTLTDGASADESAQEPTAASGNSLVDYLNK